MNRRDFLHLLAGLGVGAAAGYYITTFIHPEPTPTPTPPTATPTPITTTTVVRTITQTLTPPPPITVLHWITPSGAVLDGNVLNHGKEVLMEEDFNDITGPKHFDIFESYDTVFDWLINQYGRLEPRARFNATRIQEWVARSDRAWLLPAPLNFRGQSTFYFQDDRGKWSTWIRSTSLEGVSITLPLGLHLVMRKDGILEVKAGVEIEWEITFASDPRASLVLMLPWGRGEADLKDYLFQYLGHLEKYYAGIGKAFCTHFCEYLPSKSPEGWNLALSHESITGYPGELEKFTLKIRTPTPGKTLLAVKAILDEDPSRFVVSEILGIESFPCTS